MTLEERIERIESTIDERDRVTNGEFSNVIAMLHSVIFDEESLLKYLTGLLELDEDSSAERYVEQLERFLNIK
jgi:uncharacterized coiled-coil protein SlyX